MEEERAEPIQTGFLKVITSCVIFISKQGYFSFLELGKKSCTEVALGGGEGRPRGQPLKAHVNTSILRTSRVLLSCKLPGTLSTPALGLLHAIHPSTSWLGIQAPGLSLRQAACPVPRSLGASFPLQTYLMGLVGSSRLAFCSGESCSHLK